MSADRANASAPTQHPTATERPEATTDCTTEPTSGAKAGCKEREPAKATTATHTPVKQHDATEEAATEKTSQQTATTEQGEGGDRKTTPETKEKPARDKREQHKTTETAGQDATTGQTKTGKTQTTPKQPANATKPRLQRPSKRTQRGHRAKGATQPRTSGRRAHTHGQRHLDAPNGHGQPTSCENR